MPARPAYFHRLSEAIEILRRLPSDWIDRRTLQETLGVSKTVAWRVLRNCGAVEGPGYSLVCTRQEALEGLQKLRETVECQREIRRRQRLGNRLGGLLAAARSRQIRITPATRAAALASSRLAKLPPGIDLAPGRLSIEFRGMGDFLEKIGAVVFALQNDFEAVAAFPAFLETARAGESRDIMAPQSTASA